MHRCRLVAMVLLASACGGSVDPTTEDLEGEWDVLITNVQHFELTWRINFSMQLREIESPNSCGGEIPRDTGIRWPNGFIHPLDRELSNLVFEPDGENLTVTVGVRPFAVVEL
jgi:hypothetical protein